MADTLRPRDATEVEAAVQSALAGGKTVEIVGHGSKRAIGRPAQTDLTLDLSALSGVTLYEPEELVLSARGGVGQDRIDGFAAYTDDRQWIHVDVKRARRESPFGLPTAHGYLILALLPRFFYEVGVIPPDVRQAINYGAERVRFVAPVRAGSRVVPRGTISLAFLRCPVAAKASNPADGW